MNTVEKLEQSIIVKDKGTQYFKVNSRVFTEHTAIMIDLACQYRPGRAGGTVRWGGVFESSCKGHVSSLLLFQWATTWRREG